MNAFSLNESPELYLWIDSLCINQNDTPEKSKQVPRMTEIYGSAFTTVVWLGTTEEVRADLSSIALFDIIHELSPLEDFERPELTIGSTDPDNKQGYDRPEDFGIDLLKGYCRIIWSEYFKRSWVVQEYTLSARQPVALLGYALLSFEGIYKFHNAARELAEHPEPVLQEQFRSLATLCKGMIGAAFGPDYMPASVLSPDFLDKSAASQLLWIIMNQGSKGATVPHDHLYSRLGMIRNGDLPETLVPDYEKPFGKVFEEYTRYIIDETKDLRLLLLIASDVAGAPSWVADFRSLTGWANKPLVAHSGHFSPDDRVLNVSGVKGPKVIAHSIELHDERSPEDILLDISGRLLTAAAKIQKRDLKDVWQEWFAGFVSLNGVEASFTYLHPSAEAYLQALESSGGVCQDRSYETPGSGLDQSHNNLPRLTYDCYVLFEDGTVFKCAFRAEVDRDGACEVWTLQGATQRYVLHEIRPGHYAYCGWISEPSNEYGMDQDFFDSRRVEQIAIV